MSVVVDLPEPGWARAAIEAGLQRGIARAGFVFAKHAQGLMQRTGGVPGATAGTVNNVASAPGEPPAVQTGAGRRSVVSETHGAGARTVARVGSSLAYMKYLEYGATSRPKTAQNIAIPINYKAKRAVAGGGRTVRSVVEAEGLFVVARQGKPALLCKKVGGKNARIEPWFVLVKMATIRPRPWLTPTMYSQTARAAAGRQISESVRASVKAALAQRRGTLAR